MLILVGSGSNLCTGQWQVGLSIALPAEQLRKILSIGQQQLNVEHDRVGTNRFSLLKRVQFTRNNKHSLNDFLSGVLLKQRQWGWQWHQLDHMQVTYTLLRTDNHASTSSIKFFYKPHALFAAQPTASKHWSNQHNTHTHTHKRLTTFFPGQPG